MQQGRVRQATLTARERGDGRDNGFMLGEREKYPMLFVIWFYSTKINMQKCDVVTTGRDYTHRWVLRAADGDADNLACKQVCSRPLVVATFSQQCCAGY